MDFREELKAGVEKCVQDQRRSADHTIHQAFLEGVRWYMEYQRKKNATPPDPTSVS